MLDIKQMSDEELEQIAGVPSQTADLSQYSDEELAKMAGIDPAQLKPTGPETISSEPWQPAPEHGPVREPGGFWSEFKKGLPQATGATVGALAGGALGTAVLPGPGTYAGGIIGAGIGGAGGKGWQQAYEADFGAPGSKKIDLKKTYKEQAKAAAVEAGTELAGGVATKALSRVAGPLVPESLRVIGKKTFPDAPRLSKAMGEAAKRASYSDLPALATELSKKGVHMTGGQQTLSPLLDWVESASEGAVLGRGRLYWLKNLLAPRAHLQFAQETADQFWRRAGKKMSKTEAGEFIYQAMIKSKDAKEQVTRAMYSQIDDLVRPSVRKVPVKEVARSNILGASGEPFERETTKMVTEQFGGAPVDMRKAKKLAWQLIKEAEPSKGAGSAAARQKMARRVAKWEDSSWFMEAHSQRSDLLEEVRKLETGLGGKSAKVKRVADKLSAEVDAAMEAAAKAHGEDSHTLWRAANRAKRLDKALLNTKIVRSLERMAEDNPEKVADLVIQPDGVKAWGRLRRLLPEKTQDAVRASYITDLISKSTVRASDVGDVIVGKKFMSNFNKLGQDMQKSLFPDPAHLDAIRDIGRMGELYQSSGAGGGRLIQNIMQASGMVEAASSVASGKTPSKVAILTLGAPGILGRIMASKRTAILFAEHAKLPPGTPKAMAAAIRIARMLTMGQEERPQPSTQKAASGQMF